MAATVWNPYPAPIFTQSGDLAAGALAYFYAAGTSTPLAVYTDGVLSTPHTFPVVASVNGVFPPIFLPYANYRARVEDANGVLIYDVDGISNPAPASGGGGGGIVVAASQIFQTGDPIWRLRSGAIDGFVRMNNRTIGSAISTATERANADCQALFSYLWTNLPDSICPVSSGRGVSSSADWSANKTIVVPTMQGITSIGVDDMGATASQNIQVITTASVSNGSPTCTVASATGVARGMYVIIDGVAAGTISAVNGTTVTLSAAYSGSTNASASFRASFVSDAQQVGAVGGLATVIQTDSELATHNHAITDAGHKHDLHVMSYPGYPGGYDIYGKYGGSGGVTPSPMAQTETAMTGITINNNGSGLPMLNMQPSRAGTYYMKL